MWLFLFLSIENQSQGATQRVCLVSQDLQIIGRFYILPILYSPNYRELMDGIKWARCPEMAYFRGKWLIHSLSRY